MQARQAIVDQSAEHVATHAPTCAAHLALLKKSQPCGIICELDVVPIPLP
ncbi:MAG: hypothetical protein HW390_2248 [Candidatus Brocadiaceae bacterium]|nr:hypothetical protein [Candidatus Brocadiaceae bacterium]